MAGIYIHIPFCKQACSYCNFYFSTSLFFKEAFLKALITEIEIQSGYLNTEDIDTIYFGGGTPSILSVQEIDLIFGALNRAFKIKTDAEITLEANPDDLDLTKLKELASTPINRLSIGVQSFRDEDLQLMGRAHNATEAFQSITNALELGFDNISVDLIYGVPGLSNEDWLQHLQQVNDLGVKHLSCYALTVEENTRLFHEIKKQKTTAPDDENTAQQFELLQAFAQDNYWDHYETSNLCKEGYYSKHNTSYWGQKQYLGLGPSAHSYNGDSRQWNIASMKPYIESIEAGEVPFEKENLTEYDKFNEYIMTSLRTKKGILHAHVKANHLNFYKQLLKDIERVNEDFLDITDEHIRLNKQGKFYADGIASNLFQHDGKE